MPLTATLIQTATRSSKFLGLSVATTCLGFTVPAPAQVIQELPEIVVVGKAEDLLGEAATASEGSADAVELLDRPYLRRSEILETVPGLITTQHAGGGKATQYFLRGFNLDHGTDFAVSIDRTPINLRTHAHGQGYADLNFLIPEFIEKLDYKKGTYFAQNGDLSTAGSADFHLYDVLPDNFASVELGENDWYRAVTGVTVNLGNGQLTLGGEINYYDGPWVTPEDFKRWNGLIRYFTGDDSNSFSITMMGGQTRWSSSDQIPQRAVAEGIIDRLGTIDQTTGGESQRYSLALAWQRRDGDTTTRLSAYGVYYDLDLFSNFTYFLDNPAQGDQFEQKESRLIFGGEVVREWKNLTIANQPAEFALGLQTRNDLIDDIGLYKTRRESRLSTVRQDDVYEASVGIFAESTVRWTDWFRTTGGIRGDLFFFDVDGDLAANSGSEWDQIVSPKLNAIFGPWYETELYLSFGTGFHSNDARGVNTTVDPASGEPVGEVDPLVRTIGAEVGIRTQVVPTLTSTLSFWWLDSDSELVYVGDAGTNEAGAASRRFGVEWTNYWRPTDWFTFDSEIAVTHSRFRDTGDADLIPNSIPLILAGGFTIGRTEGPFAGVRARAFAPRPLEETGEVEGRATFSLNGEIGYRRKNWEVSVQCLNILDRQDNDIEYFYASRLPGEPQEGVEDIHFHPAEPRTFRLRVSYKF